MKINPKIFRAYDIRGKYPDEVNEDIAELIGHALVQFVNLQPTRPTSGYPDLQPTIVVGRDCRLSSPALFEALSRGMTDQGADIIDIGQVTTDTLYFAQGTLDTDGGVMITGSHLGGEKNGFKMLLRGPKFLCGDFGIPEIKKMVMEPKFKLEKTKGKITKKDILTDYINHILKIADAVGYKADLADLKMVIDAGNGVGGPIITAVFKKWSRLNLDQLVPLYFEPDGNFPNHEPNPLIPENTKDLQKKVQEVKADLGAAYDGDADRVIFIDERGQAISSDMIIGLIAEIFLKKEPGAAICYNLTCSHALPEKITELGGKPIRTRTGHAFMKEEMRRHKAIFGGEISGHIYYRDNFFAECGPLTCLLVLRILAEEKRPFSELIKDLQKYHRIGEVNFEVEDRIGKIKELEEKYSDGKIDYLDGLTCEYKDWWLNARPSNTEPLLRIVVEAKTKELAEEKLKEITESVKS